MSNQNEAILRAWHAARRRLARCSVLTGLAFALTKMVEVLALIAITAWSYSVWGNDLSPLAYLLVPSLWLVGLAVALRGCAWLFMFRTTHWHRTELSLRRLMKTPC
jgi:hypothetical protein